MDLIQPLAAIVFVAALLGGALFALRDTRKTRRVRVPAEVGSLTRSWRWLACFALLKRRGATSLPGLRQLEVIERVSLDAQHALHLVRAGDRLVLIATAPSSCQLLDHAVSTGEKA